MAMEENGDSSTRKEPNSLCLACIGKLNSLCLARIGLKAPKITIDH